jgi:hypothetical protein
MHVRLCCVYYICSYTWNGVFLIYGGLGLAWLALWLPLAQDAPPDKLQLQLKSQLPLVALPSVRHSSSSSQSVEQQQQQQLQSSAAAVDSSSIDSAVVADEQLQQQRQQSEQLETPVGLKGMLQHTDVYIMFI